MSLHAFSATIAPSSGTEWTGSIQVERDIPMGSIIEVSGTMNEAGSYRWLELDGSVTTLAGRKKKGN